MSQIEASMVEEAVLERRAVSFWNGARRLLGRPVRGQPRRRGGARVFLRSRRDDGGSFSGAGGPKRWGLRLSSSGDLSLPWQIGPLTLWRRRRRVSELREIVGLGRGVMGDRVEAALEQRRLDDAGVREPGRTSCGFFSQIRTLRPEVDVYTGEVSFWLAWAWALWATARGRRGVDVVGEELSRTNSERARPHCSARTVHGPSFRTSPRAKAFSAL